MGFTCRVYVNKADIQMSKHRWLKGWLCSHAPPTDSRFPSASPPSTPSPLGPLRLPHQFTDFFSCFFLSSFSSLTYVSSSWGTTSWLDHILCSSDASHCTSDIKINYDCVLSDHHPISGTININVITPYIDDGNIDVKQKVAWDKLPDTPPGQCTGIL